jgi:hypothetical protein
MGVVNDPVLKRYGQKQHVAPGAGLRTQTLLLLLLLLGSSKTHSISKERNGSNIIKYQLKSYQ